MKNKKITCATSFGPEGLKLYARAMIESFIQHWPQDIVLEVYLDDISQSAGLPLADNVRYLHLTHLDLIDFKNRNSKDPRKNGIVDASNKPNFLFDSIRFSHKVFAVEACARSNRGIVIWLDGDTKTFAEVTRAVIATWLPKGKFAGFLDRPSLYTETGFHIFDMEHPIADDFFRAWVDYYKDDSIYSLAQWTDCHTYDAARKKFDQSHWFDLSPPEKKVAHVFINGILGTHMDHMKGPRKIAGHSNRKDLFKPRTEEYWRDK